MKAEHKLSFDALCGGKLGLTPTAGAFLSESAEFCLFKNDHPGPVTLNITGDAETYGVLQWSRPTDEKSAERTYGNRKEAAEDGACAVAIVVVTQLEKFPAVAKSPIGTGMDYWMTGDDDAEIGFSGYLIVVNEAYTVEDQRVAAAHELSHYMKDRDRFTDRLVDNRMYSSELDNRVEEEADKIALYWLVPGKHLSRIRKEVGYDNAEELARVFRIPVQEMKIRIGQIRRRIRWSEI